MTVPEGEGVLGAPEPGRIVVVLGRETGLDVGPLIAEAWQCNVKLLVLVLGLPLTPAQERVCGDALQAAGRRLIELEERVVLDAATVTGIVRDGDRVVLSVSDTERNQLGPISESDGYRRAGP